MPTDGIIWDSYLRLCRLSASDFFTGLLPQVGLDNPFVDGCLRHVVKGLEKALLQIKDTN